MKKYLKRLFENLNDLKFEDNYSFNVIVGMFSAEPLESPEYV